jgi:hypothetical protein
MSVPIMADKSIEYHLLLSGFVRLHILHHAAVREIHGQSIMDAPWIPAEHGTVYPIAASDGVAGLSQVERRSSERRRPAA